MGTDHSFGELAPLGSGPLATVYAGIRTDTGDAVALKVFGERLPKRVRADVERELTRLAALRGQAPVLVADGLEDLPGDRTALRMELCTQSLTELIAGDGPLSIADALALARSVAAALVAAHEAGIVHGGVTPGNVLFRPSGEPVLADFGLTLRRAFPRDPAHGVDFLPPETVRDGTADERSDLYGLGVVMYLALSGSSPHPAVLGEQPDEQVLRVLSSPVPRLDREDLPEGMAEVVSALLAKDPSIRPGSVTAVAGWLAAMAVRMPPSPQESTGDKFDDFRTQPREIPPPRPKGEPLFVSAPRPSAPKLQHAWPVIGIAGGLVALVTAGVLVLQDDPDVQAVPTTVPTIMTQGSAPPAKAIQLELVEPVDHVNFVELSWRSPEQLDFMVLVAAEGEKIKSVWVQQSRSTRIDIDPTRAYCFQVQGTDGVHVYDSAPKSLRDAKCKL